MVWLLAEMEERGMKERVGEIARILLIIGFLMIPCSLGAEEGMPLLEKGTKEIGFGSGYGWSYASNRHVESVPFNFRWGCVLTEKKGSSFWKGNWELLIEGSVSYLFHNQKKYGLGANGLIRYNFLSGKRWVPFLHRYSNPTGICSLRIIQGQGIRAAVSPRIE